MITERKQFYTGNNYREWNRTICRLERFDLEFEGSCRRRVPPYLGRLRDMTYHLTVGTGDIFPESD